MFPCSVLHLLAKIGGSEDAEMFHQYRTRLQEWNFLECWWWVFF